MIIYNGFREIYEYYKLKSLITPIINTIINTIQFPTTVTNTILNLTTISFSSTITWAIPPNYTGVYHDFNGVLWFSGQNFGNWQRKSFIWYGNVTTTVVIYGNTTGTVNLYRLTVNPTSTTTVYTWSGTINNALTLSYANSQPVWYGAFAYYFNLANTVTAVIYYNFSAVGLYTTVQMPIYISPIATITVLLNTLNIYTYTLTQSQTLTYSNVVVTVSNIQEIAPYHTTSTISVYLIKNGPYANWITTSTFYYVSPAGWVVSGTITSYTPYITIYT
mgnify:CR=1 FL=1